MFVDLQGFIVGKKFIVKEVAVLRKGAILSLIFLCVPWTFLTNSKKYCASRLSFLTYHHGLQWEDTIAKRLITMAVIGAEENNDKALIYVKGCEKREWLAGILDSDNSIIETLVWIITKI